MKISRPSRTRQPPVRLPAAERLSLVSAWSRLQTQPLMATIRRRGVEATVIVCDGKLIYARCGALRGRSALEACAELRGPFLVSRIDDPVCLLQHMHSGPARVLARVA